MKYIDADKLIAEINKRLMDVNLEKLRNMGSHLGSLRLPMCNV